ncbi:YfbK domain-containing protein [Rubrivirga sp. IMCC45206]|uniref:YfbK domain-containing protein n=1 Tax=Rubrivirga sp. IMCC45206 TaxID=3391614 RepID=UPI00398FCE3A
MRRPLVLIALLAPLLASGPPLALPGAVVGAVTDAASGEPLIGAAVQIETLRLGATTDIDGRYRLANVPDGTHTLAVQFIGYEPAQVTVSVAGGTVRADVAMTADQAGLSEVVVTFERPQMSRDAVGVPHRTGGIHMTQMAPPPPSSPSPGPGWRHAPPVDREGYAPVDEVGFRTAADAPLSTFSIDVDRASYANTRRFLTDGTLPPVDAVRVEEFVNSFDYGLDGPTGRHPFAVSTEITTAPWAPAHHLVRIGLQGRRIETEDLPPANLVFLIDVSGSMRSPDKLPLLQRAFRLLVREMRPQDRVALVVYAGASGLVLPPTSGEDKTRILDAIDGLYAGGSTGGAEGLRLAYEVARRHFDPSATNRVILATDGDFNVGESSDAAMQRLVETERESGVFLSVLGFGTGNLQDSKMETLADHGNGNYAYIDSAREAERVFVREFGGTLFAIAKDVKIQVEFNPARVAGYRLIGYENRALANEDFNDDAKDAGELGAGHTVTALYEIVPVGVEVPTAGVDGLKYQTTPALTDAAASGEWMTVALRYKPATDGGTFADTSVRLAVPVAGDAVPLARASEATRWAVAVTEAALLLRQSDFAPGADWDHALALARGARGDDPHGDRAEFVRLVETARVLAESAGPDGDAVALGD